MEKVLKLIPKHKGLIVRDPITKSILPIEGELKPLTKYWRRRINEGSVAIKTQEIKIDKKEEIVEIVSTRKNKRGGK